MAAVHRGAFVPAGRTAGMSVKSGTKTTTRPVIRADLAAVVRASPVVWNWYPAARKRPTTRLDTMLRRLM